MQLMTGGKAIASVTCSGCDRQFQAKVELSEGDNRAYVRCAECRHINNATDFEAAPA